MNPTTIIAAIALGFGTLCGGGAAWVWKDRTISSMKLEYADEKLSLLRTAQLQSEHYLAKLGEAQRSAAKRVADRTVIVTGNRTELDGLRNTDAAAMREAASSLEACTAHSAAQGLVLNQCTSRLVEMAEVADGHASDAQILTESWPE